MRRILPQTLLRLTQQSARPVVTSQVCRANSTSQPKPPFVFPGTQSKNGEASTGTAKEGTMGRKRIAAKKEIMAKMGTTAKEETAAKEETVTEEETAAAEETTADEQTNAEPEPSSSDTSSSSTTSSPDASSSRSDRTSPRDQIQEARRQMRLKVVTTPAPLPPSFKSMRQRVPMKVQERREKWPDHPHFTREAFTDPEVFDVNRATPKRLPHELEVQFDYIRNKGFLPGDPAIAQTHFLDMLRLWRGRIRGQEGQVWNHETKEWQTSSRLAFFIDTMEKKGLPLGDALANGEPGVVPMETADLVLSGRYPGLVRLEAADLQEKGLLELFKLYEQPAEEGKVFDEYEFEIAQGTFLWTYKPTGQASEIPTSALGTLQDQIFNWSSIEAKFSDQLKEIDRTSRRTVVVGHRVYLPNISIKLLRNHVPKGEAYDPYVATFRIPTSMTKQDLRSYLKAVYNLDVTFIRTAVFVGELERNPKNYQKQRQKGPDKNYKRAVVGLTDPFHYPDDLAELKLNGLEQFRARLKMLNEDYYLAEIKKNRTKALQAMYPRAPLRKNNGANVLPVIMKRISERRRLREQAIDKAAKTLRDGARAVVPA